MHQFPNQSINQSSDQVSKQQMADTEKCIYNVGIIIHSVVHLVAFINAKRCFMDPNQKIAQPAKCQKSNLHTAVGPRTKMAPRKLFEYVGLHMRIFLHKYIKMKLWTRRTPINF